jgi:hypothetical protein
MMVSSRTVLGGILFHTLLFLVSVSPQQPPDWVAQLLALFPLPQVIAVALSIFIA